MSAKSVLNVSQHYCMLILFRLLVTAENPNRGWNKNNFFLLPFNLAKFWFTLAILCYIVVMLNKKEQLIWQHYIYQRSSIQLTSVHYMWHRRFWIITGHKIMRFIYNFDQDDPCGNTCAYSRLRVKSFSPV